MLTVKEMGVGTLPGFPPWRDTYNNLSSLSSFFPKKIVNAYDFQPRSISTPLRPLAGSPSLVLPGRGRVFLAGDSLGI